MTTEDLTAAEILARLDGLAETATADDPDDGARTITEWASLWGINRNAASARIRAGMKAGLMSRVTRQRETMLGHNRSTPCFVWIDGKTD